MPRINRIELVQILSEVATGYPDSTVRQRAADCTHVVVSRQLKGVSKADGGYLLRAVRKLVPEDRLLNRDCQRIVQQLTPSKSTNLPKPVRRDDLPERIHTIQLPGNDIRWSKAITSGRMIFVAGHGQDELVLVRSSWQGVDRPGKAWKTQPGLSESPIILTAHPLNDDFVLTHVVGGPVLSHEHVFAPTAECPRTTTAGAIRGMSAGALAALRTARDVTWLLEVRNNGLTLVGIGPTGEHVFTNMAPLQDLAALGNVHTIPLYACGGATFAGFGNNLYVFDDSMSVQTIEFDEPIAALVGAAPILLELDEVETDVAHRAARLYRFDRKKYKRLTKQGFNFEI